jgi:hypothetical protein
MITTKLPTALAKYNALCPMPAADVGEALETVTELRRVLQNLADQIAMTEPADEEGHSQLLNDGYLEAVDLLRALAADDE